MNDHLTPEELELLSMNQFHGRGLFKALKHLEECRQCRSQIKLPTKEEILKRFEEDEEPPTEPQQKSSSPELEERKSSVKKLLGKLTNLSARHN